MDPTLDGSAGAPYLSDLIDREIAWLCWTVCTCEGCAAGEEGMCLEHQSAEAAEATEAGCAEEWYADFVRSNQLTQCSDGSLRMKLVGTAEYAQLAECLQNR